MNNWQLNPINFKFQISDWIVYTATLPLQVKIEELNTTTAPVEQPDLPETQLVESSQGFCIRNLPIAKNLPVITRTDKYIRYIPLQYPHCYIDLSWSFEQYIEKFSPKTRSTIRRKIRKYTEYCDGELQWKTYSKPEEVTEFFEIAKNVSVLTYQERLLDAGLPNNQEFIKESEHLANKDQLRAYILFHNDRPVSYLYCPAKNGTLIYSYLGYNPEYQKLSVGTILQWLAIEQIFSERKFKFFDFTEGLSSHKLFFSSHQNLCANVFFVRRTLTNTVLIHSHWLMDRLSKSLGNTLDRYGLKTKVKKLLRRG